MSTFTKHFTQHFTNSVQRRFTASRTSSGSARSSFWSVLNAGDGGNDLPPAIVIPFHHSEGTKKMNVNDWTWETPLRMWWFRKSCLIEVFFLGGKRSTEMINFGNYLPKKHQKTILDIVDPRFWFHGFWGTPIIVLDCQDASTLGYPVSYIFFLGQTRCHNLSILATLVM